MENSLSKRETDHRSVANYIILSFIHFLDETVIIPLSTISGRKSVIIPLLLTISGMITRIIARSSIK